MGQRKVYTDCWYKMPRDWRHLTNGEPEDKTIGIRDEHYGSPTYRTKVTWKQLKDEGVFTLILVVETKGRTGREIADDAIQSAREVWDVKRHIAVAENQGVNGQSDLFLSFRLPTLPPVQEVEQLYRKIKGL